MRGTPKSAVLYAEDFFEPIEGRRLSMRIAEQLQKAIVSGALPEGDRLPPERELAMRFQASRSSVQQAIHILELMGLVVIRRGTDGGAFVTKPDLMKVSRIMQSMLQASRFDAAAVYQARLLIEPAIAELAAHVATPEDIATLRASIDVTRKPLARGDPYPHVGRNFHYLLACATGSELLTILLSALLGLEQAAQVRHRPASGHRRVHAHDRIVDAIERRDGEAARRHVAEHLQEMLESVTKDTLQQKSRKERR
jgi:GntR family transcriptional repressor for pyruvate dehydrogenase complex